MDFLMTFDFDEVIEMYLKAKKENLIEHLWQQWLVDFSKMDKEHFTSFKDYKKKALEPKVRKELNANENIAKAEKIKNADQKAVE